MRIEAIKVWLTGDLAKNYNVMYRTHVQNVGWTSWSKNKEASGTTGRSLRVEALRIKLTGNIAKDYDVYYRVHAQSIGWLDWAKNGQMAGTSGCSYRLEAVQIKLVKKGSKAPTPTATPSAVGKWNAFEAQYRNNSSVKELLEVKYTGGSKAWVVLRQKKGSTWTTVLSCQGYVGSDGIGQATDWLARTPEGNFGITKAFGINGNPGSKLPYVHVNSSMYWCSDEGWSYNKLININDYPHWCTGEHLIDYAPHYNYGLFFDYNTNPAVYGGGSALFVHCTGGASYTGGCIAVSQANMIKIIKTVSPGARLLIYPN